MSASKAALQKLLGLFFGYRLYGGFVARQYALDDSAPTPATRKSDGVDFVPTRPFYLLGQHFSAIAAAGPIAGPILAAQQFGWLPALVWISIGVVFIGAVHDLSTLVASVRHDARSIAEVVKLQLGARAGTAMLIFIWVALIYVIVAFTDVTASTFVQGDPELEGLTFDFHPGGAVAAASMMYLLLALLTFMAYLNGVNLSQAWIAAGRFQAGPLLLCLHGGALLLAWLLIWWRDHGAVWRPLARRRAA